MNETPETPFRRNPWHMFPPGWKTNHWLVPFKGDQAIIHHGHNDPGNHSMCGPRLLYCSKAMQTYVNNFPESAQAKPSWELTEAGHPATWVEAGVNIP